MNEYNFMPIAAHPRRYFLGIKALPTQVSSYKGLNHVKAVAESDLSTDMFLPGKWFPGGMLNVDDKPNRLSPIT